MWTRRFATGARQRQAGRSACGHDPASLGYHPLVDGARRHRRGSCTPRCARAPPSAAMGGSSPRPLARVRRLAPEADVTVLRRRRRSSQALSLIDGASSAKAASLVDHRPPRTTRFRSGHQKPSRRTPGRTSSTPVERPSRRYSFEIHHYCEYLEETGPAANSPWDDSDVSSCGRTRLASALQAKLWPDWRYHCFATSRDDPRRAKQPTAYHRGHARCRARP